MKKAIKFGSALVLASAAIFSSCSRGPAVVKEDSENVPYGKRNFSFTMYVNANATKAAKEGPLEGVEVTLVYGDKKETKTTGADGSLVVTGLEEGVIAWFVNPGSTSGLAMISGQTDLSAAASFYAGSDRNADIKNNVSVFLKVPRLSASLKGKLIANVDLNTQTEPAPVQGAKVRVQYTNSANLAETGTTFQLEPNYYEVLTGVDGVFSFSNLPSLDNTTGINAEWFALKYVANAGETIKFELAPTSANAVLVADKGIDLGIRQLMPNIDNTATVTGLVYGDFNLLDKVAALENFDGISFGSLTNYEVTKKIIDSKREGSVVLQGTSSPGQEGKFSIFHTSVNTFNGISNVGNVITLTGAGKLVGTVLAEGTVSGTQLTFPTKIRVEGNFFVLGNTTVLGVVRTNYKTGKKDTVISTNLDARYFNKYVGYSEEDIKANAFGSPFIADQIIPVSGVAEANAALNLPAVSDFVKANMVVKLSFSPASGYIGKTEFVTTTDASGKFTFTNIPTGHSNYRLQPFFTTSYSTINGYTKVVNFNNQIYVSPPAPNEITDLGVNQAIAY